MSLIATMPSFESARDILVKRWENAGKPRLVRFEGFDGVGKTGLADLFCNFVNAVHVKGDAYIAGKHNGPYQDGIRKADLSATISTNVASGRTVVLDAVCLEDLAPSSQWGRGYLVYVKRLSFNDRDPIWHEGINLDDSLPEHEIARSINEYHRRTKPHLKADLIIEFPERGHTITPDTFDRASCFDPPGSEIISI
jgi:hypothetical protein